MLFVVATPIGHLADISQRALDALRASDAILCEDTRHSLKLLQHYGIQKKLIAYHKFTEQKLLLSILKQLQEGKTLSLISDAGTPCINDPGHILVNACIENHLAVSIIPGPCSIIQALVLSGFSTQRFQFLGFLPKNPKTALKEALSFPGTTVAFESPERLNATLALIEPDRELAVVREMTKRFEECKRGKAKQILEHFTKQPPKGEIVLVIKEGELADDLSIEELVNLQRKYFGLDLKEAIKQAARLKGLPKRDVYEKFKND